VNGPDLAHTDTCIDDVAVSAEVCPVGCIIRKRVGFSVPIGEREFDKGLIGTRSRASAMTELSKARIATASLAGCFGCHMAILDIDERLIALMKRVDSTARR
jgi:hypothetical protein